MDMDQKNDAEGDDHIETDEMDVDTPQAQNISETEDEGESTYKDVDDAEALLNRISELSSIIIQDKERNKKDEERELKLQLIRLRECNRIVMLSNMKKEEELQEVVDTFNKIALVKKNAVFEKTFFEIEIAKAKNYQPSETVKGLISLEDMQSVGDDDGDASNLAPGKDHNAELVRYNFELNERKRLIDSFKKLQNLIKKEKLELSRRESVLNRLQTNLKAVKRTAEPLMDLFNEEEKTLGISPNESDLRMPVPLYVIYIQLYTFDWKNKKVNTSIVKVGENERGFDLHKNAVKVSFVSPIQFTLFFMYMPIEGVVLLQSQDIDVGVLSDMFGKDDGIHAESDSFRQYLLKSKHRAFHWCQLLAGLKPKLYSSDGIETLSVAEIVPIERPGLFKTIFEMIQRRMQYRNSLSRSIKKADGLEWISKFNRISRDQFEEFLRNRRGKQVDLGSSHGSSVELYSSSITVYGAKFDFLVLITPRYPYVPARIHLFNKKVFKPVLKVRNDVFIDANSRKITELGNVQSDKSHVLFPTGVFMHDRYLNPLIITQIEKSVNIVSREVVLEHQGDVLFYQLSQLRKHLSTMYVETSFDRKYDNMSIRGAIGRDRVLVT